MKHKPRAQARHAAWAFDMPAGLATHGPTGLEFRVEPLPGGRLLPDRAAALEAQGYSAAGECWLPPPHTDRRPAGQIDAGDAGDANAPGVVRWAVLASHAALQAVFDSLALQHGPGQAGQMLPRICREAGERWIYRVRLERQRTDGTRAH